MAVLHEFEEAEVADVKTEILRRDFFQFMRFIENDGAVVRQNSWSIGLSNGEIREEQMSDSQSRCRLPWLSDASG